jgi:hypothetical protein
MPASYGITTGGIVSLAGSPPVLHRRPFAEITFQLPDAFPGNLLLQGIVQGVDAAGTQGKPDTQLAVVTVTPNSLALPAVPGSGNTFWNVQVDPFTGTATIFTSSTADPAPQPCAAPNAANVQMIVARQTLPTGSTLPWANPFNVVKQD